MNKSNTNGSNSSTKIKKENQVENVQLYHSSQLIWNLNTRSTFYAEKQGHLFKYNIDGIIIGDINLIISVFEVIIGNFVFLHFVFLHFIFFRLLFYFLLSTFTLLSIFFFVKCCLFLQRDWYCHHNFALYFYFLTFGWYFFLQNVSCSSTEILMLTSLLYLHFFYFFLLDFVFPYFSFFLLL